MAEELDLLKAKMWNRKCTNFQPYTVASILAKMEHDSPFTEADFVEILNLFYDALVSYLERWAYPYQSLKSFQWIKFKAPLYWDEVAGSLKIIRQSTVRCRETKMNYLMKVHCQKCYGQQSSRVESCES